MLSPHHRDKRGVAAAAADIEGLLADGENGGRTSPVCAAGGVQSEGESEEGEGKQTINKAGVSTARLTPICCADINPT